ncbi:hypothetical protein OO013_15280 [Mangrovivirga sp. M17]|uniref:GDSL-like lipase/acylhydrolase family protein n=1 Tax=Mangrovivirga halotolerans TaxID=2993936 RepID=A0ABT3RV48_9BACT|nr:hypothetical protein [Mangrovivirga halotolerans]MCX2745239.1 hypothetical protein [Mangrovivirga halotolerans]
MKNIKFSIYTILSAWMLFSCTYDFPESTEPQVPTSGDADFTKVVAIGNSLTAGYMDGALYRSGQENNFVAIMAAQMQDGYGGGDFNIPLVDSDHISGKLILANQPGGSPAPTPIDIIENYPFEVQQIGPYDGEISALNNFGIPGVTIQTAQTPALGTPGSPLFNGLYARIASSPGSSTLLGDAAAAMSDGGTFLVFWLGNNDVLGYATGGASNEAILTEDAAFQAAFNNALNTMLTASPNAKGIVANIPYVIDIPFFTTIPYNSITFTSADEGTINALNSSFEGFNNLMDFLTAEGGFEDYNLQSRKVNYIVGDNPILINDEDLLDLGPVFDILQENGMMDQNTRAALVPYEQSRPATSEDLFTLTSGRVLGTAADPNNPLSIIGVVVPLSDQFALTPQEKSLIKEKVDTFNGVINSAVNDNNDRLVLADVNAQLTLLRTSGININGSSLNATFVPPNGGFSVDGVHPNQRGHAWLANYMIDRINAKFGSNIEKINPNDYSGNSLPFVIQ